MKNLIIAALLVSTFACKRVDQASKNNFLNLPLRGEISTLDPANSYDAISGRIVYQAYEQLFEYHYLKRPYTVQPLLADGLPKIEDGGKKYTFKIKKNVQYHDDPCFKGQPRFVKAQDFITQIKRLAFLGTKSNGFWLFDNKVVGLNEFRKKAGTDLEKFKNLEVKGLQAPDDHTLVVELTEPYPQMLYVFAMSFTSPIPLEAVEQYNNLLHDQIIGTGPFQLKTWERSSKLILKKFPKYHGGTYPRQGDRIANDMNMLEDAGKPLPFLDGITFHIMKEAQTRWLNFLNGKIDVLDLPKDNFTQAIDSQGNLSENLINKNIKLQVAPTKTYWWIAFNMKDPVVGNNLNLRKAIAHSVDVKKYIQTFTNNIGQKANSIYPPGIPGYNPNQELPYEYSIKKAKEYLAKAGYPEGKGLPVINYDVRGNSTTNRQQADFMKAQFEKVGIKTNIILNPFPAFLDKLRKGKLQVWQGGWAMDYPDAENTLQLLISKNHPPGPNSTYFSDKKFDKLFDRLKVLPDGPEKVELMEQMESIIQRDLPWAMLHYERKYILYHERLKNYRDSDIIYNQMKYFKLDNKS